MADTKISDLTALTGANVAADDEFVIVDTSAAQSKRITKTELAVALGTNDTLADVLGKGNTTGGTDIAVSSGDDIIFADSSKAIFGAGSDLQIYSDGSNSIIEDTATGKLILKGTDLDLKATDATKYLQAVDGGAVTLFYADATNGAKLATGSSGIEVTGNITVSGTVDGRDVATDGTKLDGIESGATADQTASEILTAIKTVDGAGSGLDADTLDGVQASSFLQNITGQSIKNLSDVYSSMSPSDGQVLVYDTTNGWQAETISTSASVSGLADTTITSIASGEILKWNGAAWINNTLAEAGIQPSGSYLTGNQTITLSGDVSGSGTTSISVTVADDSHNHIISNVDGLQTALDAKLASSSYTASDVLTKIKTVDGSGSGLDADTVDGVQGTALINWYSRNETSTTTNRSVSSTWTTHLSLGSVVVPSGYTGIIFVTANMANNSEGGNGWYQYRIQTSGAATVTSQVHDGGYGYHAGFNPRSTKTFGMTLSTAGTYTLNLQVQLLNGSVTLNQFSGTDYLSYELFTKKN